MTPSEKGYSELAAWLGWSSDGFATIQCRDGGVWSVTLKSEAGSRCGEGQSLEEAVLDVLESVTKKAGLG